MPRDGSSSVRAVVRVRPLLPHELEQGAEVCCEVPDAHSLLIQGGSSGSQWRQYTFDACLQADRSQKQAFQESGVASLLDASLLGYSSTILAYGQTGSGKTYTMMGRLGAEGGSRIEDATKEDGLIARSAKGIFRRISSGSAMPHTKYSVSASFTEIFNAPGAVNECICDLLNPSAGNLQVRQNKKHGFFVSDLSVVDCHCAADVRAVLEAGVQNRRVAAHALNKDSSRSHAMFTLYIDAETAASTKESGELEPASSRYGKITFVDLAGSERLKATEAEGHMRKEAQAINKSLFILGQVISQLASGKADQHVPYRNSKLTQLLQESFGGEALCLMITCISPSTAFAEESLNSLKYATKAMHITLSSRPVVRMDERQRVVHDLKTENAALRQELGCYRAKFGELPPHELILADERTIKCVEDSFPEVDQAAGVDTTFDIVPQQFVEQSPPSRPPSGPVSQRGSRPGSREADRRQPKGNPSSSSRASPPALSPGRQGVRGRSSSHQPPPPPALVVQPPKAGRALSEGPKKGYAMVAAKRQLQSEQRHTHHPPRRRPSAKDDKGAPVSLPPIPRRPASGNSVDEQAHLAPEAACGSARKTGHVVVERDLGVESALESALDDRGLRALRRGSGIVDMQPQVGAAITNEILQSPLASPSGQRAPERSKPPHVEQLHPAVPVLKAPPPSKAVISSLLEPRQAPLPEVTRSCTQSQIQRLDSFAETEWQFDFGGSHGPGGVEGIGGSAPGNVVDGHGLRRPSRCSTSRSSSGGSSASSSRAASPSDSLNGYQGASSMMELGASAGQNNCVYASKSPTTASGTPAADAHYQHLSLAELNSKLSSMEMATSALLSTQTLGS